MKVIVGLGNPGKEYVNTRHNIGYSLLDFISEKRGYVFKNNKKFNALCSENFINNEKIILVKPLSYMNLSGIVVKKIIDFYGISANDILVIQDDLDMVFGKVRILYGSSSGGHNGIKNIIENICTKDFVRLKIGISNDKSIDTKDYVLSSFSEEEIIELRNIYSKLENIIEDFISYDVNELKQIYNSKN